MQPIKMTGTHQRTPCASAVLAHFGASGITWNNRTQRNVWDDTLRRHGYAVRSRTSQLPSKGRTVAGIRQKLAQIAAGEPQIQAFAVTVRGHVLVVDRNGQTVVDTAPNYTRRKQVVTVHAIWRKS